MQIPSDNWIPADRTTFDKISGLQTASPGDWFIKRDQRSWKLYIPEKGKLTDYNIFYVGFSTDPRNFFSEDNKKPSLVIKQTSTLEVDKIIREKVIADLKLLENE